jgi:hypothetical protein
MEIVMSRTIRAVSVLGATAALGGAAALGLAVATPAGASTVPAGASASAPAQAGLAFSGRALTGQSKPLLENQTCTFVSFGVDSGVTSFEVTDGKSTITFYSDSSCTDPLPVAMTPQGPWLFAEEGNYYSSTTS